MAIHQLAYIEEGAVIGSDCDIGAFAVIHKQARLGNGVKVFPHAVIGGDPQDLGFDVATPSFVDIEDGCVLREHVTVHRATKPDCSTRIGANSYLMANAHVAHDCVVHAQVIMANAALLAGHVHVGARTFMGGGAAIHQFVRIGEGAMIGGLSRITRDCPPFSLVTERDELSGFNIVGLRRRQVPKSAVDELKRYYRAIFQANSDPVERAAQLRATTPPESNEARLFLDFFVKSKRGFVRPQSQQNAD
jgi:UDP-N-acetylglucosamine acyltransferase